MGFGEIILIVLILVMIFGAGWIFGLAGWVRKGIRTLRREWDAGKDSAAR
ncbi:MAG: twin-arginine translocase TatA/TatE family subunit [Anaerolineales bacterium]|nr:twin-arginine translocase TatA/TatE family subunit [Anaerolineales bacterium]